MIIIVDKLSCNDIINHPKIHWNWNTLVYFIDLDHE